ncbi:MAG: thiolase family protein [Rhodospirillaceae bacterium]|jgi:acetyl-CoA C-acetyltransferase
MSKDDIFILGGARTPIGRFGGAISASNAVDIGATAIAAAVKNAAVSPDDVNLCVMGHARQAGNGPNPARLMALKGGLPKSAPAFTTQMACISGLLAVIEARAAIMDGEADVAVVGGCEHMSSIPYLIQGMRWGTKMGDAPVLDGLSKDGFRDPLTGAHMGELADHMAKREGISREDQDQFSLRSQQTAAKAIEAGHYKSQIEPVEIPGRKGPEVVELDEHPRPDTKLESLAKLKPVFVKDGSVTAGSSSGITDGACALVIANEAAVKRLKANPRARIMGASLAALVPEDYTIAPVESTKKLMKKLGVNIQDVDQTEINEAFAAMAIACTRMLDLDPETVNNWGGAIALGHPIGMSGARILLNTLQRLEEDGGTTGLATLCGNGGHGASMLIEKAA